MKTNNKISAYILRGSTAVLLFSCVIVALCSAIYVPQQFNNRTLSLADRVAYQTAIEDIYWRHRIWPKTNPGPKPTLEAVMSNDQIEKKVEEYLRKSQTLEDDWQRPITADQLQAEMERMASNTQQPEVLQELFEALGNDPFIIAECLARPIVAERLIAEFSSGAKDASFRAKLRLQRSGGSPRGQAFNPAARLIANSTGSFDSVQDDIALNLGNAAYTLPVIAGPSGGCTDDTWTPTTLTNAPSARRSHTAVWTGSEMIVWGGYYDSPAIYYNTGSRYNPTTDSWTPTSATNAPTGRTAPTAVWTGTEMIVWGGIDGNLGMLNTGGRYNPITDSWTATSTTNAPTARYNHTAVSTGQNMIVWGGCGDFGCFQQLSSGGRYNPDTDSWTATSTTAAPTGRFGHTAVWQGSEMIVWGGYSGGPVTTGGRYSPSTDSWTATSTTNAPTARYGHTAVWTGSEMIVWGGGPAFGTYFNTGGRYDPILDSWTATSTTNAPSPRGAPSVWSGREMIVWGGYDGGSLNTGGRYSPSTDSWRATGTTNAPDARYIHTAVWTDSEMIVWGGLNLDELNTGGRYCAAVGLRVISSNPACGSVVFTQLTDFVINLSDPVQPATVQASDFMVNGTPANSFTFSNDNTTITFHYTSSPVIAQGAQTMHIPAGAFLRDPDGDPVIEFDCTFHYDATHLSVTDTVPPVGGTFSLPAPGMYQYDLNWNEAVDPTSVETSDLTLGGNTVATVTSVQVINGNTTTRFTLNISFGGSLTADITAGGIIDQFGFPNAHFSGGYTVKGPPSNCIPPPANMVSWWLGDGNTHDIVGGNNGTFVGAATYSPGEVGQAFNCTGSNYVDVQDAANLDFAGTAPITVDMWVYRTGTAGVMHMLGKRAGGCGPANYQMAFDGTGGLQFGGSNGGVTTGEDLPLNTWTHLAATFDGSTFRFYINGKLAGTAAGTSIGPTNNAPLRIGTSGTCDGFVGLIDEVELFNRALSQSEIQAIVNAGSSGKCRPQGTSTPTPTPSPTSTATATPTATATSTPRPTPAPRSRPTPAPRP